MARSDGLEASPKRPGSVEIGVESDRAEKKPRLSEANSRSLRKRSWSAVEDAGTGLQEAEGPSTSRKVICVGSIKTGGDKLVEYGGIRESKESESNGDEYGSKAAEMKPQVSLRRWTRLRRSGDAGLAARSSGVEEEERMGELKQFREHEVVRKVLRTVQLEEAGEEETAAGEDSDGTVSSLKQSGRDKKRRGSDKAGAKQPEKKLRIDEASSREVGVSHTGTWRRLKGPKPESSAAASEGMGVSVSEAWKRLREENDTGTSGSSVNGRSDSDLSMHSSDSEIEILAKRARHDPPPPPQGRKWARRRRQKESSSSKRLREGGCESSGSSGSDLPHPSYYHNRKWKRPRFEYMMSMSWRKQTRDVDDARVSSRENARKRVPDDPPEKPSKRQRK